MQVAAQTWEQRNRARAVAFDPFACNDDILRLLSCKKRWYQQVEKSQNPGGIFTATGGLLTRGSIELTGQASAENGIGSRERIGL